MIEQNMAQMEDRMSKDHMTYGLVVNAVVPRSQLVVGDYVLDGPLVDL